MCVHPNVRFVCQLALALLAAATTSAQTPLGSGFTYQGRLDSEGTPVNDTADFDFRLWDAAIGGNQIGATLTANNVNVVDGLFTVELDFGVMAFNGDTRWLEIAVANPAGGPFAILTPRQPLTGTPYAHTANSALSVAGIDGHSLDSADGAPADAVFVDNAGKVGIGTNTPQMSLEVTTPSLYGKPAIGGTDGINRAYLHVSPDPAMIWHSGGQLRFGSETAFGAGFTELMRITSSGNVGIGTPTPTHGLEVVDGDMLIDTTRPFTGSTLTIGGRKINGGPVAGPFAALQFQNVDDNNSATQYVGAAIGARNRQDAGTIGTDDGELVFSTASNLTLEERMVITNIGQIGIGTAIPNLGGVNRAGIEIEGNVPAITLDDTTGLHTDDFRISNRGSLVAFEDATDNVPIMLLDLVANPGFVAIGNQPPLAKLHVGGTAGVDGIMFPDGTLQTTALVTDGSGLNFPNGTRINRTAIIDQTQESAQGAIAAIDTFQSFTPGVSGALASFAVRLDAATTTTSGTVTIYEGEGTAGAILSQSTVTYPPGITQWFTFPIAGGPHLQSGMRYTIRFSNNNGDLRLAAGGGDPYPNGQSNFLVGGVPVDLAFRTFMRAGGILGVGRDAAINSFEVEGNASKSVAGDWLANSDRRIKTNIETVANALDMLDRVRLVSFEYTDDYQATHAGVGDGRYLNVIAQEFAEVFPDHVKGSGERLPDGSEILQVDTYPLTIYSAAAIQELRADTNRRIAEKDAEIATLTERLARLETTIKQLTGK